MDLQQEISTFNETVALLKKLTAVPDKVFNAEKQVWETVYDTYCSKAKLRFKNSEESRLFDELFTKKTGFTKYQFGDGVKHIINAYDLAKKIKSTALPLPTDAPRSAIAKLNLAEKMAPFLEACDWSEVKKTVEVFQNYDTYCKATRTLNEMATKAKAFPDEILPCSVEDANYLEAVKEYARKRTSRHKFFTVLLSIPTCGILFLVAFIIYLLGILDPDRVTALFTLAGIFTPIFIFIPVKLIKHFNKKIEDEEKWGIQYGYSYVKDSFLEAVKKLNATKIQKTMQTIACIDTLSKSYNTVSTALDIRYSKEDLPSYKNLLNKGLVETLQEARDVIAEQKRRRSSGSKEAKEIADLLLAIQAARQEKRQAEREKAQLDKTLQDIKKGAEALNDLKEIEKEKQKALDDIKNSLHHY